MSTDAEMTAPAPVGSPISSGTYTPNRKQHPKKYLGLHHQVRVIDWKTGKPKTVTRIQVIRHRDGFDLPKAVSPQVRRAWSSKYMPHTGKKEIARMERQAFETLSPI